MMKTLDRVISAPAKHWVGDGFHVQSMFSYSQEGLNLDPFLLLDYAAPQHFPSNNNSNLRGVGEHPHRGFETVTIAYQGEVEHKDSFGGGGVIGTGDVQWMTAGSGLMHQEYHSENFSKVGGMFEMVQLWVNLPAKDKMTNPRYQSIQSTHIPKVDLNGTGTARIIAGEFNGIQGSAQTFSPINMWDIVMTENSHYQFTIPEDHNLLILVLDGCVQINQQDINAHQLATFKRDGQDIEILAQADSKLLLLSGEPLNEPIVGYGPFVMNTMEEINQAVLDFRSGKFGHIDI